MPRIAATMSTLVAIALCATVSDAGADARLVAKGRALLDDKCGRCHAVGQGGASTHAKAPPFRVVANRYPPEALAESLAEGIVSGHPDMPEVAFPPHEIDAIVAYLDSLVTSKRK